LKPGGQLVDAQRQQQAAKAAVSVGGELAREVRSGVGQRHAGAGQPATGFVRDTAFDYTCGCLRLSARRHRQEQRQQQE